MAKTLETDDIKPVISKSAVVMIDHVMRSLRARWSTQGLNEPVSEETVFLEVSRTSNWKRTGKRRDDNTLDNYVQTAEMLERFPNCEEEVGWVRTFSCRSLDHAAGGLECTVVTNEDDTEIVDIDFS